jgi:predicted aspartyl protease
MAEVRCGFNDGPMSRGCDLLVNLGPTMFVSVGFDPAHDPVANPQGVPIAGIENEQALVDTGASECCIDSLLAVQLNLPLINRREISGVHGRHTANVYLAQVHVPILCVTMNGAFAAVDLRAGGQQHSVLIGRTFLRHFKLIYDGRTGTVLISNTEPLLH